MAIHSSVFNGSLLFIDEVTWLMQYWEIMDGHTLHFIYINTLVNELLMYFHLLVVMTSHKKWCLPLIDETAICARSHACLHLLTFTITCVTFPFRKIPLILSFIRMMSCLLIPLICVTFPIIKVASCIPTPSIDSSYFSNINYE